MATAYISDIDNNVERLVKANIQVDRISTLEDLIEEDTEIRKSMSSKAKSAKKQYDELIKKGLDPVSMKEESVKSEYSLDE